MTTISMNDKHMKDLMKQALTELFEDAGLINAIREGENSARVSEEEVMRALI